MNSKSDIYERYKRGVSWNIVGTIAIQGSSFVVGVLLANILGKVDFGQFVMIQSTMLAFASITQLSMGSIATRFVAEYRVSDPQRAGRVLGLCFKIALISGSVGALGLLIASGWIASDALNASNMTLNLAIGAAFIFFAVMNGFFLGAISGLESYQALAKSSIIASVFHISVCVFFGWLWGVPGAIAGFVLSAAMKGGLFYIVLQRESQKFQLIVDRKNAWVEKDIFLHYAIPGTLSGLLAVPAIWIGNVVLARQENGFAELGIFGVALVLKNVLMFFPAAVNIVAGSILNNSLGKESGEDYWKSFKINLFSAGGVVLLGCIIYFLFGQWILRLFGEEYEASYGVLMILSIAAFFEVLATTTYQVVTSCKKMWLSFVVIVVPRDVMQVCLVFFLVPNFGANGLGLSYAISTFASFCITAMVVWKIKGLLHVYSS